ncbi:UDP-glucuronosyltransferase [Candidatus Woesearchaeota archaeon]|nr:UDP-glucuronosyltransferase [Candidatus Woesearchaeota archaeon]
MAKIVYGICGEGMGHVTRSKVILDYLSSKGHELKIITSSRAYNYLHPSYAQQLINVEGFHFIYRNNEVSDAATFFLNLQRSPKLILSFVKTMKLLQDFKPSIVMTDFEPYTCQGAIVLKIPVVTIDNEHILTKTAIAYPKNLLRDALKAKGVVRLMNPKATHHLITTFFYPKLLARNVTLVPPILRKPILDQKPRKGKHILVYQTSQSNTRLLPTLHQIPEQFIVYGLNKEMHDQNVECKLFNEEEFFRDFSQAKAVMTNGGFSLMSEAIHWRKPILSVPVKKQFEQVINALYLQRLGYGMYRKTTTVAGIRLFLTKLGFFEKNLKTYHREGNQKVFEHIDTLVKRSIGAKS